MKKKAESDFCLFCYILGMENNFQPIIKWSGSKRSQCEEILSHFPETIGTYYEPFCGGCSMLMGLINSGIRVERYVCSDINADLISLWNSIKTEPEKVYSEYRELWNSLNADNDIERKKKFFEKQRAIYNETHSPYVFFFIMRTTTNGMPRYNSRGEFNNSFHVTRNGIEPERLYPILMDWSRKLTSHNVEFVCRSYEDIANEVKEEDFVYMDPPYFNTKGMYMKDTITFDGFFSFLKRLCGMGVKFALSFDGKSGDVDNTCDVPKECYETHMYIKSGNSSFKRTIGKDRNAMVYESLYLNYKEDSKGLW